MAEAEQSREELPAWSLPSAALAEAQVDADWPHGVTREWAFGGSTGAGVRVGVIDSGVDAHPLVGVVQSAVAVERDEDGALRLEPDDQGDLCGHGNACAGVIRGIAPECEIHSVRVLGAGFSGNGALLLEGLRHALQQRYDVINLSLSTTNDEWRAGLHELADQGFFQRSLIVASAHNMPVESFPWRFASVISVGSHDHPDALTWYANPKPPVELFARGVDVEVAWQDGDTISATGNSFATPHISGICALIRAKHPTLTPAAIKHLLMLLADNARRTDG
jgi:subtilisin family serine protease